MAEPAHVSADEPDKARPRKSDPLSPGWVTVREGMITQALAMSLDVRDIRRAVEDLKDSPADPRKLDAALEMAALQVKIAESWETLARRQVLDESVMAAREQQAYERGVADCKAARCRLAAVPGPH